MPSRLTETQKRIMRLRAYGWTFKEIADLTRLSVASVRSMYGNALTQEMRDAASS